MSKPSLARGTRDFGPEQMAKRTFIFDTIRRAFQRYGFLPLETPAFENLSVLMGKYGEEGDQLLFKILNSGDFSGKLTDPDWNEGYKALTGKISEKGLRYDLTVPFARYVVMNRGTLAMPFKRYQIQPVWRADRPQKGRYREFYQCDADVVGTDSLLCEAEIVMLLHDILPALGIEDFTIKINNRKILTGIADMIGAHGMEGPLCVAIDKLDKIGKEKVEEELIQRGFTSESILKLEPVFSLSDGTAPFKELKNWLSGSEIAMKGIDELETVWKLVKTLGLENARIQFDVTLARGLSYYTGAIFEVKANNVQIGSISGGGRYDNLTGTFGVPGISGVGISLGVDRIYDVMEELNLFPESRKTSTQVMISNFDEEAFLYGLSVLPKLRNAGINAEIYPDSVKLKKQLDYADRKNIPFVILIGSDEIQSGLLTLKNMKSGEQQKRNASDIIALLTAERS
ncbi:histidine--tRNA ligase [Dyadobacter sediminis]|uniref:Histidine--tRNA ligase n=1 Tax=Dyadobacter sediminis TaxID=1493691 RepID=A0A5R9KJA4_9BACT|nr:histidine--tRNA ligase [Dyadobacter sediminis]TLU96298.1 histidine--tRNA ligase [Dyadobacter sediminis]GGB81042.1 histidine--tRNA ligase [Dyadobacter sediminis]